MMHDFLKMWFEQVRETGYLGVGGLMALESTIVPIPSEVIIPPAAYWAAQGEMNFWGVVLAAAVGSTIGSAACYGFTRAVGRPFLDRWGRYFFLPPEKLHAVERWLGDYALFGIFLARLLPVFRHLIGFPAGLVRVPFLPFAAVTFVGSFLWATVLAWAGAATLGRRPDLLEDPAALVEVMKHDLLWFVGLMLAIGGAWLFVKWYMRRAALPADPPALS